MHRTLLSLLIAVAATQIADPAAAAETNDVKAVSRPATWALKLERPGLANFYQVTTNLYRGAQPTAEGMAELKAMGIKTIINLRSLHSDKDELAGVDLKPARLHMKPWHAESEDIVQFLKIAADTNNFPVFVHCQRGADRTGLVCAMYRVALCGWTKEEAIKEMREGEFAYNRMWKNLTRYIEKADVEKLKREAGIAPAEAGAVKQVKQVK